MPVDMKMAERLKKARQLAGHESMAAGARYLGISPGTYGCHENGSRGIKNEEAKRYASGFRVSFDWLMTGRGDPKGIRPRHVELFEALSAHHQESVLVFMEMLLEKQRSS